MTFIKSTKTRKSPGETGSGNYYHVQVRPDNGFIAFMTQDVGEKGGLMRLAGKRATGVWNTVAWLVEKTKAHMSKNGRLIIDDPKVKTVLKQIMQPILHRRGDVFYTKPRYDTPEQMRWSMMNTLHLAR